MSPRLFRPLRGDLLAIGYAAVALAAIALFGFSLASVGIPALLLVLLLVDGLVRPGSSLLYPTVTHGPRDGHRIALSFDDGPDPEVTPAVLDLLAQYGARATFFSVGRALQAQPLLARRVTDEHHELGNHSWTHTRWHSLFGVARQRGEMKQCAQAIVSTTGRSSQPLYRPPMGHKSPPLASAAQQLQLTLVAWSLHSHDSRGSDPERIAQRVLQRLRPGDIVLMHDGHDLPGQHRPACVPALRLILRGLRERGLQSVTVSELLRAEPKA